MRTICIRTKIDPEFLDEVRKWFKTLKDRLSETMVILENEKVLVESVFLDKHDTDVYLIYYLKAEDIDKAYEVFDSSTSKLLLTSKNTGKNTVKGEYCDL